MQPPVEKLPIDVVIQRMETWTRYCYGVPIGDISMTGRLIDGMGSTVCATCKGRGRIEGWKVGSELDWVDPCPKCGGKKLVTGELASIRTTKRRACDQCEVNEKGELTGEFAGRTCFRCGGRKVRIDVNEVVNPAGIRNTRHFGINEDVDPVSLEIDRTVAQWSQSDVTVWMHIVTIVEYRWLDSQEVKAANVNKFYSQCGVGPLKMRFTSNGISQSYYSKILKRSHEAIENVLRPLLVRMDKKL